MKHNLLPEILEILRCPECESPGPLASNGNGHLRCSGCHSEYPLGRGYVNLCPDFTESVTPIQYLCQSPPMIAIYENIWRPLGYFFSSSRSFPEDLERISALMEPSRHGMILDLGCGPGNFTRHIARCGRTTTVVGFDLAEQMLHRAVDLSPNDEFSNVCYMRGNALDLPFESGSFDAVICCGALQIFTDYAQALSEVARVLKPGGEFVCQTIVTPNPTPLWLRMADRIMSFGYFRKADLKTQLQGLELDVVDEESSKVSYIFRAEKRCQNAMSSAG